MCEVSELEFAAGFALPVLSRNIQPGENFRRTEAAAKTQPEVAARRRKRPGSGGTLHLSEAPTIRITIEDKILPKLYFPISFLLLRYLFYHEHKKRTGYCQTTSATS